MKVIRQGALRIRMVPKGSGGAGLDLSYSASGRSRQMLGAKSVDQVEVWIRLKCAERSAQGKEPQVNLRDVASWRGWTEFRTVEVLRVLVKENKLREEPPGFWRPEVGAIDGKQGDQVNADNQGTNGGVPGGAQTPGGRDGGGSSS